MSTKRYINNKSQPCIAIDGVEFTLELIQDLKCIGGLDVEVELYKIYKVAMEALGKNYCSFDFFKSRSLPEALNRPLEQLEQLEQSKPEIDYLKITRSLC
jgi:hypothetical protein